MKYLLDTDHITFLQRRGGREHAAIMARLALHSPADFAFPVVSFQEQAIGAHAYITKARKSSDVIRGYALLQQILTGFSQATVLPFDGRAAAVFDDLQLRGIRVGTMDKRIAAIAIANGLVLLTRNTIDFARIPTLQTADWTS